MALIHSIDEGGGELDQIVGELIDYTLDVKRFATAPTSPTVIAYDLTNGRANVTSTVFDGSPGVNGTKISLPTLKSLTADHRYLIRVQFTEGGSSPIVQFIVNGVE